MKSTLYKITAAIFVLSLAISACTQSFVQAPSSVTPTASAPSSIVDQPYEITGDFTYTNDIITTYYSEQAVALVDMDGFVKRDKNWEIPVASQTLGFLSLDASAKTGKYTVQLPAKPTGQNVDVDNNGKQDVGVQVFAVSYWPNLTGGPYSEGDDASRGWPTYLASVITDSDNQDEVVGGNLVVWAPDANQQFPTGFGADKKLFTADDPVGPIPAGYSIINLDKEPFSVSQTGQPSLKLFEPKEAAIKDFSKETYSQAFDDTFNLVRLNYAFAGIQGKEPNWDKLYADLKPRVDAAEKNKDANAFYLAMRDFTWAFKDGHVGLDGGDYGTKDFQTAIAGGYGFAIRELDDGTSIVVFVGDGSPAAKAGMKVGAEVTQFNDLPIKDAIAKGQPYSLNSSDYAIRYQQARYFLRAQPGTDAKVAFTNPGGSSQTVTLTAIAETDSFSFTSIYHGVNTDTLLPVEDKIINDGNSQVGYVIINSNYDDLNLIIRLFQRALQQFTDHKVSGIIIDLRYNSGGAPLGLAGFLTKNEITMGQLEYYSNATKKFEPEGDPEKVTANVEQFHFDKMAVLVGPACYSACELEAYGFSQVPGMMVIGQYPTAGVEAEVSRGQFLLPEGMSLQIPFGRFILPDGSLFLEGQGVKPTVKVPVDANTVLSSDDVVLKVAVDSILKPLGAGITPTGAPTIADASTAQSLLSSAPYLEDKAREKYQAADFSKPGTLTYTVSLAQSDSAIWTTGWCASSKAILENNFKAFKFKFVLDGQDVSKQVQTVDGSSNGQECRSLYFVLTDWPAGEHHITTTITYTTKINDGSADYQPGDYILDYSVYVKP